jgi:pimeloyl-ACP methyl ester carboxylesterase
MKPYRILIAVGVLISAAGCALSAEGQATAVGAGPAAGDGEGSVGGDFRPADASSKPTSDKAPLNLKSPTLGGKFYWADELVYHDWRIQRHADEGHYRLIDGDDVRHAWGTFEQCRDRLEAIKRERKLPPLEGAVVLVLHGLGKTRISNEDMVEFLRAKSKYTVLSVGYASTQADVASHARALARVVEHLGERVDEINFVAHSLGNIVIRHYLSDHTDLANGHRTDPRIKRIVMIGAPNNGARMAEVFGQNSAFERVLGKSGRTMAREWNQLQKHLAVPQAEFGIIAGGKQDGNGYNPFLDGDDDFIVKVEETKLPGARDFLVVDGLHAILMSNPDVQKAALRFLEHGYFVSEERRRPLPGERRLGD